MTMNRVYNNIIETIGNTPMVRLNKILADVPGTFYAKVEYFNPGNSIKDRIGLKMVEDAEASGRLKPGGTIIECTSGNTGMGIALASVIKGYKCIFTTTDKQSKQKIDILKALGAEVIVCPTNVEPDDPKSYYSVARRLSLEIPNAVHLNQYDNLSNRQAHYESTGPEIWRQTEGGITHYISTIGTGGTITGTAMYLKEQNPDIKILGVDVFGSLLKKYHETGVLDMNEVYPYVTEGIGEDFVPQNYDMKLIDHIEQVTDKEGALMTRALARTEGLFCGYSAGTIIQGVRQMKHLFKDTDVIVLILHDHGSRYVSKVYNDDWMRERGFLVDQHVTAGRILEAKQFNKLVFVEVSESLSVAFRKMREMNLTQLPVLDNLLPVGSIDESLLLNMLMDGGKSGDTPVGEVMKKPFPMVQLGDTAADIARKLSKEVTAVMVKNNFGDLAIITEFDLISMMGV